MDTKQMEDPSTSKMILAIFDARVEAELARKYSEETEKESPTVLYIEDNPANLALVKRIFLLRDEVQLLTAPEARLGLKLARAHLPNLILMDINLPGMSGIEALQCLKTYEEKKDIPAIAIRHI